MAWLGTRIYLAVDAQAVTAAAVVRSVAGERLRSLAYEPLPAGAVAPGPSGSNLADAGAVRAAATRALGGVGRGRVTLVLPDGVARLALLVPARGVPAGDYVRYRLAPALPWPASEGVFDALDAGSGRVVGAAVARATVAEYERALAAAGVEVEQVHLAPLLALARLRRERHGAQSHALLGDVAMCLAFVHGGGILSLRSRRRDRSPGEAARLRAELLRLAPAMANGNGRVRIVLSGSDAPRLRPELEPGGFAEADPAAPALATRAEAGWLLGLAT